MMSLEAINALNEETAALAAAEGLVPFVPFSSDDVDSWPAFPFPNLGSLEPEGWIKTEISWFVDSSGFGREGEPALTVEQFKDELREYISAHPGRGFAITEAGQFQVYISAFEKE